MARDLSINPVSGKGMLHGVVCHGVAFADNGKSQPSVQDLGICAIQMEISAGCFVLNIVISKSDEFSLGLYPPRGSGSSQGRRPLGSKNFFVYPEPLKNFVSRLKQTDSRFTTTAVELSAQIFRDAS